MVGRCLQFVVYCSFFCCLWFRLLVVDRWLFVVCCWRVVGCFGVGRWSLFVGGCLLYVVCCLLRIVRRLLVCGCVVLHVLLVVVS